MKKYSQEVEVSGHLIDSMILTKIFDKIMNRGGEFEILELTVGKKKKDSSYAKLLVSGKNAKHLKKSQTIFIERGLFLIMKNKSN